MYNFPMTLISDCWLVGSSEGLLEFPERAGSFTSMLLWEHLFIFISKWSTKILKVFQKFCNSTRKFQCLNEEVSRSEFSRNRGVY